MKHFQSGDSLYTSEYDVHGRQSVSIFSLREFNMYNGRKPLA